MEQKPRSAYELLMEQRRRAAKPCTLTGRPFGAVLNAECPEPMRLCRKII